MALLLSASAFSLSLTVWLLIALSLSLNSDAEGIVGDSKIAIDAWEDSAINGVSNSLAVVVVAVLESVSTDAGADHITSFFDVGIIVKELSIIPVFTINWKVEFERGVIKLLIEICQTNNKAKCLKLNWNEAGKKLANEKVSLLSPHIPSCTLKKRKYIHDDKDP